MTCAHAHTRPAAMGREGHLEAISGGRRDFFSPSKSIDACRKVMFLRYMPLTATTARLYVAERPPCHPAALRHRQGHHSVIHSALYTPPVL